MLSLLRSITRRAWIAFGILGTLLTLLFLPVSWKQRADVAATWGPLLQSINVQALLITYAVVLTGWLFWIDIRPEIQLRKATKAFHAPDAGGSVQLKEEVVNFSTSHLRPAFEALLEANRISAYVIKDSWDHPANFLVWQAFAQLQSYDGQFYLAVTDRVGMMRLNKKTAQIVTLELLKQYRQKMHRLIDTAKILKDNSKPLTLHSFDGLLHKWLDSHSRMVVALKRLQALPGIELLKDFDTETHFESLNYNAAMIESALAASV